MNNEIFQEIFDILAPEFPKEWEKMIFYAGYTNGSYSMKFYTSDKNGIYTDCFSQAWAKREQLIRLFMRIDKLLAPERKLLDDKMKWSVMTMVVEADGNMKTEFDYDDISENSLDYEKEWKEKYLK